MPTRSKVLLVVLALFGAACSVESLPGLGAENPEPAITLDQSDVPPPPSKTADIVERVLPSVVNVRVRAIQSDSLGQQELEGQGSGAIIDAEEGIILTNNHVVQCAVEVKVAFTDPEREPVSGVVLGTAPEKDLAIVKIDADGLRALEIGRSSALRLGDEVIAFGFPLGLGGPTVTRGILSGEDRRIAPEGAPFPLEDLLQTDAAINPGNSGGPLVDANGHLVGINTAAAGAASAENVGFAIPIDGAIPVIEEIITGGDRPWLGVSLGDVRTAAQATELGLDPDIRGAVIAGLLDGPAEAAGLGEGDVIVDISGRAIRGVDDLTEAMTELDPRDGVAITVERPDGSATVELELAERPPPEEIC